MGVKMKVSKTKAEQLMKMPTIGYWSELGGVEVKEIVEDNGNFETEIYGIEGTFAGTPKAFRRVLQYGSQSRNPRDYINLHNHILYMDECIRNGI